MKDVDEDAEREQVTPAYTVRRSRAQMLSDIGEGLRAKPKHISPKYFYDERGSELFEEITRLPEYYLTRAERVLLERAIPDIVSELAPCSLVELGAGSATKTRIILDAMRKRGCLECYVPIDVSRDFLEAVAVQLRSDYRDVRIIPVVSDITEAFELPSMVEPTLIVFLGSTIGNFSRDEAVRLLTHVAQLMSPSARFLLGADLIKDSTVISNAYNDSRGVTAEFNLNVLRRLNRELGADFPVHNFEHRAFYNEGKRRIEMHLVAREPLTATIPSLGAVDFEKGESILTELSYKYDRAMLEDILCAAGLSMERWIPAPDGSFVLALACVDR